MNVSSLEAIFRALNDNGVRYIVAGGLAVVAHGHVRLTADLDLLLDMTEENLSLSMRVFQSLGYKPRAPVAIEDFVLSENRDTWIRDKNLKVFSLFSSDHPSVEIDIFAKIPLDFPEALSQARSVEVASGLHGVFLGLKDLISLKEQAGRPKDLDDIRVLRAIEKDLPNGIES